MDRAAAIHMQPKAPAALGGSPLGVLSSEVIGVGPWVSERLDGMGRAVGTGPSGSLSLDVEIPDGSKTLGCLSSFDALVGVLGGQPSPSV